MFNTDDTPTAPDVQPVTPATNGGAKTHALEQIKAVDEQAVTRRRARRPKLAKAPTKAAGKPAVKAKVGRPKAVKAAGRPRKAATKAKRKARTIDPAKLDQFQFRKGSLKSKAAAMFAARRGATLEEVKDELDSTQFNLLTELEERGYKVERTKVAGDGVREITRYHIVTK